MRRFLRWAVASALLTSAACKPAEPAEVTLKVRLGAGIEPPDHLVVSWLSDSGIGITDLRVPAIGSLVPTATDLATVRIEIAGDVDDRRTVTVLGRKGDAVVTAASGPVPPPFRSARAVVLILTRNDADGDGELDEVDPCPQVKGRTCVRDGGVDTSLQRDDAGMADARSEEDTGAAADAAAPQPLDAGADAAADASNRS